MSAGTVGFRDRALLPRLGQGVLKGPPVLDTNVFINALAGRGPPELRTLLANLPSSYISGPTMAELNWPFGRLDPLHPDTSRVLNTYAGTIAQIDAAKILTPTREQWEAAGVLAGRVARAVAGRAKSINTAFDRVELINDTLTAVVSIAAGATVITQDGDFDLIQQLEPTLDVLFYD